MPSFVRNLRWSRFPDRQWLEWSECLPQLCFADGGKHIKCLRRCCEPRNSNVQFCNVFRGIRENRDSRSWDLRRLDDLNGQSFLRKFLAVELGERFMFDYSDDLIRLPRRSHPPQPTSQCLLGKNSGLCAKRSERNDGGDILNVPAFSKHQHGNDAEERAAV